MTLGVAMMLRIIALVPEWAIFNPDWIALTLIYWAVALPERFGVFTACFVGIVTDILTGRLLGQHALTYSVTVYFCIREHRRFRQFPVVQQAIFVGFTLFFSQCLVFTIESMKTVNRLPLSFWYPVFTGTALWPLVYWILRTIRVVTRIS